MREWASPNLVQRGSRGALKRFVGGGGGGIRGAAVYVCLGHHPLLL